MGFRARQAIVVGLTAVVVAIATGLISAAILGRQHLVEVEGQADLLARTLYHLASRTIREHPSDEVRAALAVDPSLREYVDAVIGYSPIVVRVAVVDDERVSILHSDVRLQGRPLTDAPTFAELERRNALALILALFRGPRALDVALPFRVDDRPFGAVVVGVSTVLVRQRLLTIVVANAAVAGSTVVLAFLAAFLAAQRVFAPIDRLRDELARIAARPGEPPLDLRRPADVGRLVEFFTTIGDRLAEERGAAAQGETLGGLIEDTTPGVVVVDRDARIVSINEEASGWLGRSRGELVTEPLESLVAEALERGEVVRSRAFPSRHAVEAHPLRGAGAAAGAMILARDLRRLSRIGSRLAESHKLAGLGRLTSGVAHEIKNPLNALVLQTELLRTKLADTAPEAKRHLDVVEHELRRLDRVIDGFLKFIRPEEIRLETVDLGGLVRETVELSAARAERSGIAIETAVAPDLPTVRGSADLLRQALLNLVSNAIESMPDGGRLEVRAGRSTGGPVALTVADTGIGIAPENLERVFDLFYTTRPSGTGLGLSFVYRVTRLHGGDVRIESEPGAGTRVTMTLPEIDA